MKSLPDPIKYVLRKKFGGFIDTTLGEFDVAYLQGLSDAGIKGADELIAAIEKHETIVVKEL